jgi:hypothetical protein
LLALWDFYYFRFIQSLNLVLLPVQNNYSKINVCSILCTFLSSWSTTISSPFTSFRSSSSSSTRAQSTPSALEGDKQIFSCSTTCISYYKYTNI